MFLNIKICLNGNRKQTESKMYMSLRKMFVDNKILIIKNHFRHKMQYIPHTLQVNMSELIII